MADIQNDNAEPFLQYVRQIYEEADLKSTNEYALRSFLDFMSGSKSESLTKDLLTSWIATLFIEGKSAATAKRYLCRLHTVYLDWIGESTGPRDSVPDPFDGLLALTVPDSQVESAEPKANLNLINRLVSPDTYIGVMGKWKAIFFCLLYNPGMSVEELVTLRFDAAPDFCPQTVEILESMDSSKGRRYVFPLGQPDKRMTQMVREVREHLEGLLLPVGMTFSADFARERITAMWIAAAVGLGISAGEIRTVVSDVPEEYTILGNVVPAVISEKRRQEIICRVANRINDITTRWYVVNMRDKIIPDDVKDSLREHFPSLFPRMGFFYPTRQAWRLTRKKKKVRVEVPFIPGLLFIKVRSDMVAKVMNRIRDIAWGYRYLNTPSSPYSVISQKAMSEFQRCIGIYTDDIRIEIISEKPPLAVNDLVTIHGDSIDGSIGEITDIKEKDGLKTYSIRLTSDTSFTWTVRISDPLRLSPL